MGCNLKAFHNTTGDISVVVYPAGCETQQTGEIGLTALIALLQTGSYKDTSASLESKVSL